jgi:hypothetical protein
MPDAFLWGHRLNALIMASTAIPAYLLTRELVDSRLAGYLVAALSVAIPWMTLSMSFMSEVAAYPAFVWAMLAMQRALAKPSDGRDVVALIAIALAFFGRSQFALLGPVMLVSAVVHALAYRDRGGSQARSLRARLAGLLRAHRVLFGASALAGLVIVVLSLRGSATTSLLGAYGAPAAGPLLPPQTGYTARQSLAYLAVEIAVLPFVLAVAWTFASLIRTASKRAHAYASLCLVLVPAYTYEIASFTVRYAGTPDRYIFYLAPVFFVASAACLVQGRITWPFVLPSALFFAWMVSGTPIVAQEPTILSPGIGFHKVLAGQTARLGDLLGMPTLGAHDLAAALAIPAGALIAAALWRQLAPRLVLVAILGAAGAVCTANTAWTFRALLSHQGVPSDAFLVQRDWIDDHTPGNAKVGVLLASLGDPGPTTTSWYDTSFWNKRINGAYHTEGEPFFDQGFKHVIDVNPRSGAIEGLEPTTHLVMKSALPIGDCRFRLAHATLVTATFGMDLLRTGGRPEAAWAAMSGLAAGCGLSTPGIKRVRIFDAGAPGAGRQRVRVKLLAPAGAGPGGYVYEVRGGGGSVRGNVSGATTSAVSLSVAVPRGGYADVRIAVAASKKRLAARPLYVQDISTRPASRRDPRRSAGTRTTRDS